tara:strand:+ start:480 stop:1700 length:1221 start_codon:yes stop_codon:yes gene_type:complete
MNTNEQSDSDVSNHYPWLICVSFFLYEFLLHVIIGSFQTTMMDELHLTHTQFSLISTTAFVIVYGTMQLFVGVLVQRWGVRNCLAIALLLCTITTYLFSLTHYFILAFVLRMWMAAGCAFAYVCMMQTSMSIYPRPLQGFYIGLSNAIGTLGAILSGGPLIWCMSVFNLHWRVVMSFLSLIGMMLFCGLKYFSIPQRLHTKTHLTVPLLLYQPFFWAVALFGAFTFANLEYLSQNEGRQLLIGHGLSPIQSGFGITLIWIGYAVGSIITGWGYSRIKSPPRWMIICALFTAILFQLLLQIQTGWMLQCCMFLLGFLGSAQNLSFIYIKEFIKLEDRPIVYGVMMAMISLVLSINAPMIACYLDMAPHQNQDISILTLLTISMLVVMCMGIFIYNKETHQSHVKNTA